MNSCVTPEPVWSAVMKRGLAWSVLLAAVLTSLPLSAEEGLLWSRDTAATPASGSGTLFASSRLDLALPLQKLDAREDGISSGFHLSMDRFRWVGTDAASRDYYWIGLPIRYYQWRGQSNQLRLLLEPGLMTDGQALDADNLSANVTVLWRGLPSQSFFWQVGATVDRRMGDFQPRPAAAIAWRGGDNTELLLGFPETRIETGWQQGVRTWLHIRPEGGVWREQIKGQTGKFDVRYRNWRMGLGAGLEWRDNLWLSMEVGQQRLRSIEATDSSAVRTQAHPADNNYWQAGLRLVF
jgi:hypothetical protein